MSLRVLMLLPLVAGCGGGPRNGRTGDAIVDACLHWTACVTPPTFATNINFPMCATWSRGVALPWRNVGVAITLAERDCIAAASLDCAAALDCVTTPALCDQPTWSCEGDTLTLCDAFAGPRAVRRDCAAEGAHCVMLGSEAFCGLGSCDPSTATSACDGSVVTVCEAQTSWDDNSLGGLIVPSDDCADHDATCSAGQCIGNGPACTPSADTIGCDGTDVLRCDESGRVERNHCADGTHCGTTTGPGFTYGCVGDSGQRIACVLTANSTMCDGDSLGYCDDRGNETLDCKSLGYSGCDLGRCVP